MTNADTMDGRICLITGANNGIGKETALALARMGATVVMVARDAAKGAAALAEIKRRSGSERLDLMLADLASLTAVRGLADEFQARHQQLHVLVNNAGAYNTQRTVTEDGFETTFGVNHLAHFLLTKLLLDQIKASAPARIINVSSTTHTGAALDFEDLQAERNYGGMGMTAYGRSKLANVLYTYELARRLDGSGVTANCLHPGVVRTGFGRNNAGLVRAFFSVFHVVGRPFLLTPERGAETSIYLASSSEVADVTGQYYVKKQPVRSSEASYDLESARRLWQVSEALVTQQG